MNTPRSLATFSCFLRIVLAVDTAIPHHDNMFLASKQGQGQGQGKKKSTLSACWEPLLEDNGRGYFSRQEFVVPHISNAQGMFLTNSEITAVQAPDPEYDYTEETEELLTKLKGLTEQQKKDIKFFDNKVFVAVAQLVMLMALGKSFEEVVWYSVGETGAVTDSIMRVWAEKRRWNLIRPTEVVRKLKKGEVLDLWDDISVDASRFRPYVRTMPHAEYPSGSSCSCRAVRDYGLLATSYLFPDGVPQQNGGFLSVSDAVWTPAGASVPGAPDVEITGPYTFDELLERCSHSRLEAGLHFRASVPEGANLCEDIGNPIANEMINILNSREIDPHPPTLGGAPFCYDASCAGNQYALPGSSSDWSERAQVFELPPFIAADEHLILIATVYGPLVGPLRRYETPVVSRIAHCIDVVNWNCVAAINEPGATVFMNMINFNNPTEARTNWIHAVSPEGLSSSSRARCMVAAVAAILPSITHSDKAVLDSFALAWGAQTSLPIPDSFNVVLGLPMELELCNDTPSSPAARRQCYWNYLSARSSTPQAIGEAIAADAAFRFLDDSNNWNAKGAPGCQGQFCYPYEDTTGYQAGQGDMCEAMNV